MNRRNFLTNLLAAPALSTAAGLPPLTIKDVKVISTGAGRRYRWVFLKVITSEPGLWGIGSANNHFQTYAVITALEKHLKPWLIGKDPDRIEDLWQSSYLRTYWRGGPVSLNVVSAMDEALWDIKGEPFCAAGARNAAGKGRNPRGGHLYGSGVYPTDR